MDTYQDKWREVWLNARKLRSMLDRGTMAAGGTDELFMSIRGFLLLPMDANYDVVKIAWDKYVGGYKYMRECIEAMTPWFDNHPQPQLVLKTKSNVEIRNMLKRLATFFSILI
jgi:hypothetical protein